MPIVTDGGFNKMLKEVEKKCREAEKNLTTSLVNTLSYVGEHCVTIARDKGSYKDQTANLRSSIGYVVLVNGIPATTGEFVSYKGDKGEGEEGEPQARRVLMELRSKYPRGITLIVVAGMKYAVYVEEIHHKDVLASAKIEAERVSKEMLKQLFED